VLTGSSGKARLASRVVLSKQLMLTFLGFFAFVPAALPVSLLRLAAAFFLSACVRMQDSCKWKPCWSCIRVSATDHQLGP
jgi:hypothetical protein